MVALAKTVVRLDKSAPLSDFAADALAGLLARPKRLAPKYFYDTAGSLLFEEITRLPEYYPTRSEIQILRDNAAEIAALIPQDAALVEFGSGSSSKVRILLDAMPALAAYVPVDISGQMLEQEAADLRRDFPALTVLPIAADFTNRFALPAAIAGAPKAGFFPGSTIGNFEPPEAEAFLRHAGRVLGPEAVLIVGVDLIKEREVLHAAYNDAAGVTARFNLNLLTRMNRELGADFDLAAFEHAAFYNSDLHRIEMHLVSRRQQTVTLCGKAVEFAAGETIHTESSYKYSQDSLSALARRSGWISIAAWTDPDRRFSVQALLHRPPMSRKPV
jgi:dimethylhistidine N-methyltransferase